jgi:hypothetical protein
MSKTLDQLAKKIRTLNKRAGYLVKNSDDAILCAEMGLDPEKLRRVLESAGPGHSAKELYKLFQEEGLRRDN